MTKKRNKQYRPRGVRVPMMAPTRDNLAMHLHAAVETLIAAPSIDAYNRVSKMLATMTQSGVDHIALNVASQTVNSICDRYERIGKIGVSGYEAGVLRDMAGHLDALLARIPVNVFKAAKSTVNTNFEAMYEGKA